MSQVALYLRHHLPHDGRAITAPRGRCTRVLSASSARDLNASQTPTHRGVR
jgi:hypothetical protein